MQTEAYGVLTFKQHGSSFVEGTWEIHDFENFFLNIFFENDEDTSKYFTSLRIINCSL